MEEGRAGGVAKVKTLSTTVELQRNDIDDISLESNTHEQPQSVFTPPGSSPTFVGGVQSFIKGKQEQLSHFSAQKALHDFHTFSLQEYMDVKRMVVKKSCFKFSSFLVFPSNFWRAFGDYTVSVHRMCCWNQCDAVWAFRLRISGRWCTLDRIRFCGADLFFCRRERCPFQPSSHICHHGHGKDKCSQRYDFFWLQAQSM